MSRSSLIITFLYLLVGAVSVTLARKPHAISFRFPNLYPEGLAWDPTAQHFLVGSYRHRIVASVSDAGVVETVISDPSLPENITVLGLAVDSANHRLLAVIHATDPLPHFNALASYDLSSGNRLFLSLLPSIDATAGARQIANDVAVDFRGNAYVTNSAENYIWKVNADGDASIFSRSRAFKAHPVDHNARFSFCGLNGIAYVGNGYLLVVQSNSGKMFRVDKEDGSARLVLLDEILTEADGIAIRKDGVVLVVSPNKLWFLKSADGWEKGLVVNKIDLDGERFPTSVAVGAEEGVYVLYGHVIEAVMGNVGRDMFSIEEMKSKKESGKQSVWVYVLVGLGMAYFLFWRFQKRQLMKNLDKKTN